MYCMDTMLLATKYISFVTGYEHPILDNYIIL